MKGGDPMSNVAILTLSSSAVVTLSEEQPSLARSLPR